MMENELTYWVALAHTPTIWTKRKNEIIVYCFNHDKTIADFFESENFLGMELKQEEHNLLMQTKNELANYAFLVEELLNQGYSIIPITSNEYSQTLKTNLKYNAPIILYTKGNKQILQEKAIAIVGSRNANDRSLQFTDNVAKKASSEYKVVVSGFAKGVDKQALDSALNYKGQSIIVLPQGITTFASGMKKYYRQIIEGDVLVLSVFHPKSPWSVDLAMARNSIIYGLASEIYAAQSDDKGGTWSGVTDGLKKGRIVYVRMPEKNEKCANMTLINMGAEAVDMDGNLIHPKAEYELFGVESSVMAESAPSYNTLDERVVELLNNGEYTAKQIIEILHLSDYNSQKLSQRLSKLDGIQINKKGKTNKYSLQPQKQPEQLSLSL
jgi:predicted Rossmann fold nucleotide-binding protein DprA/Smf involved in DNA uptake